MIKLLLSSILALAFAFFKLRSVPSHDVDLKAHGIALRSDAQVYHNLNYASIFEREVAEGELVAANGAVAVDTGKFTGRSPKDKYIVKQAPSDTQVRLLILISISERIEGHLP
jgi:hypothetical protein